MPSSIPLIPMQTEADRTAAILVDKRVQEMEAQIGRKMPPDSPFLLAILSSPPDAPLQPLLPPQDD